MNSWLFAHALYSGWGFSAWIFFFYSPLILKFVLMNPFLMRYSLLALFFDFFFFLSLPWLWPMEYSFIPLFPCSHHWLDPSSRCYDVHVS